MNDFRELFLAIVMTKNELLVSDISEFVDTEGVDAELLQSFITQVKADPKLMDVSLLSRLSKQPSSVAELQAMLRDLKERRINVNESDLSYLLG